MDDRWIELVNADIRKCNEARVRLEERNKAHNEDIRENQRLTEQLFDYKNSILGKLTVLEVNKVDKEVFDKLSAQVTTLKAEKRFLPWVAVIISILVGISTLIFTLIKISRLGN